MKHSSVAQSPTNTQTYQLVVPTMKVISVPETPLVAFNVANLASFVLKIWLPHQ